MPTKSKTYEVEKIRKRLNTTPVRQAMLAIMMRGDAVEINRVMELFTRRGMIYEASRMIDWHSRASVGLLNLKMIRF
jgi:hypothetical protein